MNPEETKEQLDKEMQDYEESEQEDFNESIGLGTREDIEAYFFNKECGDR
jgi:hypothetical protein